MHTAAGPGPFFTLASLGGLHVGILQKTDTASRLRGGHTRFGFLFNVVPDGWHLFIEHGMPTHDLTQLRSRSLRLALSASRTGWETATAIHASGCKRNRLPLRRRRNEGALGLEHRDVETTPCQTRCCCFGNADTSACGSALSDDGLAFGTICSSRYWSAGACRDIPPTLQDWLFEGPSTGGGKRMQDTPKQASSI